MSESIQDNQSEEKSKDKDLPEKELQRTHLPDPEITIPEEIKPLLRELPADEQERISAMIALSVQKSSWKGPIPPPDILKEYNEAVPDGAERILSMAERQSEHRMELESTVVTGELKQSGKGQNYAFIIVILVLIASFYLIYTGHDAQVAS